VFAAVRGQGEWELSVNLVSEVARNEKKEQCYQPSMDIGQLTVSYVLSKVEQHGINHIFMEKDHDYEKVIKMLEEFDELVINSHSNILVKDL
jgi:membrane protein